MCNFFKNYYIYSSCSQPDSHFLRTSLDGSKDGRCSEGPHDRFIIVVGKCHLCSRWSFTLTSSDFFWRQQPKLTRIVSLGHFLCRFPRQLALLVSIRFRSQKAPIPQLPNDYLSCCFGDTFSWHRYSSFYFYAGRAGKKVCSSFVFQPFSILFLCVPFLRVFLFSHDTAWVRWFRVFVGLKNGARWDCFFFGVLFYFGIIVDIFAELITPTAFLPHVLCGRGGNVCVLFR